MRREVEVAEWAQPIAPDSPIAVGHKQKLRAHKKSRGGCRNCKLRSIKCDESRPHCTKCRSYGIQCTFISGVPDMQLAAVGSIHTIEPKSRAMLAAEHGSNPSEEATLLANFQNNVVITFSIGKRMSLFRNEIVTLSQIYPCLKHTIISMTLMYNRHNLGWMDSGSLPLKRLPLLSEQEIGSWYLATSQFNADLTLASSNTTGQHLDIRRQAALCATSALLAILTFCYIEATTPEEAWPLTGGPCPSTPADLQWIRMSNGKISAQTLVKDLATDPIFYSLVIIDEQDKSTFPDLGLTLPVMPDECLLELKQFSPGREGECLSRVADSNCLVTIIFGFWSFIGGLTDRFWYCLRYKQPEALLVLLYWFAKLNSLPIWWLKARTTLEGRAICVYLDRYHGHDPRVKNLIWWPASVLWRST